MGLPHTDEREDEKEDDEESMGMEVDQANEIVLRWTTLSSTYEIILPYPINLEKKRPWKTKANSPMMNVQFTGKGTGFRPNMNLGQYNPE